ncbi:MAG: HD domain-containing protein [Negativicutes bacterium]|nr:HD domain-containing protein [Negativicutes bacterium]
MTAIPDIVLPVKELFFAPLDIMLNPSDCEQIRTAYTFSKYGHKNQFREGGERYFNHPKAAAWIYINELGGLDVRTIINHLLHDVQEDSYLLSSYRIGVNFGKEVALDVRALTKLKKEKEPVEVYLRRVIARGPRTIITKLGDRLHNIRTLGVCSAEKREKQIEETEKYHLRMLIPALDEYGEEWVKFGEMLKNKIADAIEAY